MTDRSFYELEIAWALMTPMESALWGTTVALNTSESDGGIRSADAALHKLRELADIRSHQPEPEFEAARSGLNIEREEFDVWYPVAFRIRHGRRRGYKPPNADEIAQAYERYGRGLSDYY